MIPNIELPFASNPDLYEPEKFAAECDKLFAQRHQTFFDTVTGRYVLFHMDDIESNITDRDSSDTLDAETSPLIIAAHIVTLPSVYTLMRGVVPVTANAEGEVHDRVRRALQANPHGLSPHAPTITERYGKLVDDALKPLIKSLGHKALSRDGNKVDIVKDLASPLASSVIARIQGASCHFDEQIQAFANGQTDLLGQQLRGNKLISAVRSLAGLLRFNNNLAKDAEKQLIFEPPSDLTTQLVSELGRKLTRSAGMNLTAAGYSTTRGTIANAVRFALADPSRELWQALCQNENPYLQEVALFEVERLCTALVAWKGRLNKDTLLADNATKLPKGAPVLYALGIANRDPKIFGYPHHALLQRRVIDRERRGRARPHITYGRGPHACVGRTLAQLEIKAAFTALGNLEKEHGAHFMLNEPETGFQYAPDSLFRMPENLPVVLTKNIATGEAI
ncbi:MAG TPA: cytochrome P450 [Candidatus Saccharimonadales bacterium]